MVSALLAVNDLPVVDYPVISVQAFYPGASPDTMANNIATPLERQFMQINGLELITSQSTQGNVSLTLQFDLNKSIDAAATDVQTAISQATGSLPVDLPSPPTYSKTNPNDQPMMFIALTICASSAILSGATVAYAHHTSRPDLAVRAKARASKEGVEMAQAVKPAATAADRIAEAKVKGYEGESCRECGNFTLLRNGTCLKCDTCGGTSGCS